jgi:hypothetical protein
MLKRLEVPEDLQKPFERLIDLIPVPHRYDKDIQEIVLKYLKLKDEEFLRDCIIHAWENFQKNSES